MIFKKQYANKIEEQAKKIATLEREMLVKKKTIQHLTDELKTNAIGLLKQNENIYNIYRWSSEIPHILQNTNKILENTENRKKLKESKIEKHWKNIKNFRSEPPLDNSIKNVAYFIVHDDPELAMMYLDLATKTINEMIDSKKTKEVKVLDKQKAINIAKAKSTATATELGKIIKNDIVTWIEENTCYRDVKFFNNVLVKISQILNENKGKTYNANQIQILFKDIFNSFNHKKIYPQKHRIMAYILYFIKDGQILRKNHLYFIKKNNLIPKPKKQMDIIEEEIKEEGEMKSFIDILGM